MELQGIVRAYDRVLCYGFLLGDDRREYFVHRSEVAGRVLEVGERVVFDGVETPRGPRAVGVRRVTEPTNARA